MTTTQTEKKKTLYIVLRSLGTFDLEPDDVIPDVWAVVGEIEANSAHEAIRHIAQAAETQGEFRAVPARSFKSVIVKLETAPRYVLVGQESLPV